MYELVDNILAPAYSASDGKTDGTAVISSASADFGADMVGYNLRINGGTGSITSALYTVQSRTAGRTVTDAVTNGTTTITSATAAFVASDVGRYIWVEGGTGTITGAYYTVVTVTNATTIVVNTATGLTTGTGATLTVSSNVTVDRATGLTAGSGATIAMPGTDFLSIYSTFSLADNTSVYNTNLWGGLGDGVNFTCIGHKTNPASTYYCKLVAISPRHAIRSEHTAVGSDVGEEFTWIAQDGTLVTRTIVDTYPTAVGAVDSADDFHISYLDADLPSTINIAPVFADAATTMANFPVVRTNQFYQAMLAYIGSVTAVKVNFSQPLTTPRSTYWGAWVNFDSGSPAFLLSGPQLIYLTSAVTETTGPYTKPVWDSLLAACQSLDADNDATGYEPQRWPPVSANTRPGISLGV